MYLINSFFYMNIENNEKRAKTKKIEPDPMGTVLVKNIGTDEWQMAFDLIFPVSWYDRGRHVFGGQCYTYFICVPLSNK